MSADANANSTPSAAELRSANGEDLSEKRSVFTDALETLGTVIDEHQKRDAIHLAVEPVIASCSMRPGKDVRVENGKAYPCAREHGVGVVDPFLERSVEAGDRFWLVVYPRKITSLRHVWSHPAFPEAVEAAADVSTSEAWIRDYVARLNAEHYDAYMDEDYGTEPLTYDELMQAASESHYISKGPMLDGVSIEREFFSHYAAVTGKQAGDEGEFYFSCSC